MLMKSILSLLVLREAAATEIEVPLEGFVEGKLPGSAGLAGTSLSVLSCTLQKTESPCEKLKSREPAEPVTFGANNEHVVHLANVQVVGNLWIGQDMPVVQGATFYSFSEKDLLIKPISTPKVPNEAGAFLYASRMEGGEVATLVWTIGAAPTATAEPPAKKWLESCKEQGAYEDALVVCVDVTGNQQLVGRSGRAVVTGNGSIVPPNTSVQVRVRHDKSVPVTLSITGGKRGLSVPVVAKADGITNSGVPDSREAPVAEFLGSPRMPGEFDIEVKQGDGDFKPVAEFSVDQAVGAAVRLGVAVSDVVDSDFTAVTAPGSSTPEIVTAAKGQLEPELVVGFAPFLDRRGRLYALDERQRVAPYLALGLVALNPNNETTLSLLKSVYGGVEIELMRSSSIAATFALRRVTRLSEPYEVGGAAQPDGKVPTVTSYQPGFALVFNVSPEFFEVAKKPFDNGSGNK